MRNENLEDLLRTLRVRGKLAAAVGDQQERLRILYQRAVYGDVVGRVGGPSRHLFYESDLKTLRNGIAERWGVVRIDQWEEWIDDLLP